MQFKFLRTLLVGALALSAIALPTLQVAHAGNDMSWVQEDANYYAPTAHGFAFGDRTSLKFNHSVLQGGHETNAAACAPNSGLVCGDYLDMIVCKSTSDPDCAQSQFFQYNSILKVCGSTSDTDCIAQVSAIDSSGKSTNASFTKYTVINYMNAYPANPKLGIPAGDMPSIWSIPSAPHASGNEYAVVAGISGESNLNGGVTKTGRIMQLSLIPVALKDFGKGRESIAQGWSQSIPGIYYDYCVTWQQTQTRKGPDCNHVNGPACVLPTNDQGMCYAEEPFGAIQTFNVQLRLSTEPTGWMHGRMVDPSIGISPASGGGINLSVTAGASTVPMVYQNELWEKLPAEVQSLWVECMQDDRLCFGTSGFRGMNTAPNFDSLHSLEGQSKINQLKYISGFGDIPLKIMSAISPLVGNKSTSTSSTWTVRTLGPMEMESANKCITGTPGLKGIVTTNSVAYSSGPPEFKDGYLTYKVSSPHFNPDGKTPFKGNYSLVMRSDVARCLYGFSSAPISATISVISSEGTNDVATSVTGEKNGWISLTANNFEFSSPTIQVKFTQAKSAPKSVTITCTKGKLSKKVTGQYPACPKGYVKKS